MYVNWRGFRVHIHNIPVARPGGYLFQQIDSGKPYVGISGVKEGVAGRCRGHSNHHKSPGKFRNALEKHGNSKFLLTPLFYVIDATIDRDWLQRVEADLIVDWDAIRNGYNVTAANGGVGPYGPEFGKILKESMAKPESKAKFTAARKADWAKPGAKELRGNISKMVQADPEYKIVQSKKIVDALNKPGVRESHLNSVISFWANPDNHFNWINNGKKSTRLKIIDPLPEGWFYGRLLEPSSHNRWHVARDIINPSCPLCRIESG